MHPDSLTTAFTVLKHKVWYNPKGSSDRTDLDIQGSLGCIMKIKKKHIFVKADLFTSIIFQ